MPVLPIGIHYAALAAMVVFAFRCGGQEERFAAGCYLMINLLLFGFGAADGTLPTELELAVLLLDAAIFTVLALRSQRYWPMIACSFVYVELGTALVHTWISIDPWSYGTAQLTWFYGVCGTISMATALTRRSNVQALEGKAQAG